MLPSRAPVLLAALLAAGCGLVSGLDSLVVDGGQSADAMPPDVQGDAPVVQDAGNALSSPGACSFIEGASPLSLSDTAFTIELWLQVKALVQGDLEVDPILWNGGRTTSEPGWTLALTTHGLEFCVSDSSAATCSNAYQPPVGDLVHVGVISTVTQSMRSVQIFQRDVTTNDVTHVLRSQLAKGVVDWGTTSTFTIGGVKSATLCSNTPSFVIDDLRVYDGAAPIAQLDTDMGALPCNTSGLLAYFKFDAASGGTTAMDCSHDLMLTVAPFASFVTSPFP